MGGTEHVQDSAPPPLDHNIRPSHSRFERIQDLGAKLLDSTVLNTVQSRERCRQLAVAMLKLLDEEDLVELSRVPSTLDQARVHPEFIPNLIPSRVHPGAQTSSRMNP